MIDEKKILRELQQLKRQAPEGTLENKLFGIIQEYINRQPKVSLAQILFEQRMAAVLRAAGKGE